MIIRNTTLILALTAAVFSTELTQLLSYLEFLALVGHCGALRVGLVQWVTTDRGLILI